MRTTTLGATGLTASRVGLGLAALGRPGYITVGHAADLGGRYNLEVTEARANSLLGAAWDAGDRHLDAARSDSRSQELRFQ